MMILLLLLLVVVVVVVVEEVLAGASTSFDFNCNSPFVHVRNITLLECAPCKWKTPYHHLLVHLN